MKNLASIFFLVIFASALAAQVEDPIIIGKTRVLYSEILDEERRLNIYLPSDYDRKDTINYHVVYLLDGSLDEDFIHIAGIVQFLSFPWIAKLPPTILVGIANVDRKRDFTFPTSIKMDKSDFPTSGRSAKFIQFLMEELKPYIDKEYKTDTSSTLIGQSFGGLLATEILLNNPYLFDNYVIISPSLWWDKQSLLRQVPEKPKSEIGIFVGVGREGEIMESDAKALYEKVDQLGNVYFQFLASKNHGDVLHTAVYDAFEKLFNVNKE